MAKGYDNEDQAAEAALREAERLRKAGERKGLSAWEQPRPAGRFAGSRFFPAEPGEPDGAPEPARAEAGAPSTPPPGQPAQDAEE